MTSGSKFDNITELSEGSKRRAEKIKKGKKELDKPRDMRYNKKARQGAGKAETEE